MHELSIAMSIVDLCTEEVKKAGAQQVDKIELEIGTLSGVEMPALDFAWPAATKDTVLDRAERVVHRPPGRRLCLECNTEYDARTLYDECPACGSYLGEVIGGKELRVQAITIS